MGRRPQPNNELLACAVVCIQSGWLGCRSKRRNSALWSSACSRRKPHRNSLAHKYPLPNVHPQPDSHCNTLAADRHARAVNHIYPHIRCNRHPRAANSGYQHQFPNPGKALRQSGLRRAGCHRLVFLGLYVQRQTKIQIVAGVQRWLRGCNLMVPPQFPPKIPARTLQPAPGGTVGNVRPHSRSWDLREKGSPPGCR